MSQGKVEPVTTNRETPKRESNPEKDKAAKANVLNSNVNPTVTDQQEEKENKEDNQIG